MSFLLQSAIATLVASPRPAPTVIPHPRPDEAKCRSNGQNVGLAEIEQVEASAATYAAGVTLVAATSLVRRYTASVFLWLCFVLRFPFHLFALAHEQNLIRCCQLHFIEGLVKKKARENDKPEERRKLKN